jgi:Cu-processing system ATP-binding protein
MDLGKRYGQNWVLRDVTLDIGERRCIALLGHNGAGKTTLIKLALGLTRPSAGTVKLVGCDPMGRGGDDVRRSIGYLPENISFQGGASGRQIMGFFAALKGAPKGEVEARLEQVGLDGAMDNRVSTYSKGMRQRLGLAQALLGTPKLLFLDEPTNGLDPPLRRRFYTMVDDLVRGGSTAIVSSHVLSEIEARADSFAIMKEGALVAFGSLDDLRIASNLPYRLKLYVGPEETGSIAEVIGGEFALASVENGVMEFACRGANKMSIIRSVARLNGAVKDVDILPPRLEDIYSHFAHTGADI